MKSLYYQICFFISLMILSITAPSYARDSSYAPVSISKTFSEIMKEDTRNKSALMRKHKKLLNSRYNLSEKNR